MNKEIAKRLDELETRYRSDNSAFTVTRSDGTVCKMELWELVGEVTRNPNHNIINSVCPPSEDGLWQAIANAAISKEHEHE